jgi:hypothetical protein
VEAIGQTWTDDRMKTWSSASIRAKASALRGEINERFSMLEGRFDALNRRFDTLQGTMLAGTLAGFIGLIVTHFA